ncbi:ChaN family lipoprotein [Variovorax sp. J22R133]|uniref:ChaN family lipoprotein n=1 Tax=Variovorax brevis TaxID=3053503 RepID=UPI002576FD74|nr:ChaN family lipoprotein [Variovorax sp. J22R133]MDM0115744.1 ChaN family lipoprotein [Variovorax sp. J22R133]
MLLLLAGCASWTARSPAPSDTVTRKVDVLLPTDVLLIGEQHDAADHQRLERETVEALATQGKLAALAIEMAEQGNDTRYLDASASEAKVQTALNWNDAGWPWKAYGPVVMAAVQAGVPVYGANLPRERMKDAMEDVSLDAQLNADALQAQQQAVREGHCDMLPEKQILPMTRIQIARDRAMAQTIMKARVPGKTVVLVSGAGHSVKTLGVPRHLPTDVRVQAVQLAAGDAHAQASAASYDAVWLTPPVPERDYCAEFKATRR